MAGNLILDQIQLGDNGTSTNNFVIKTLANGSMKIQRGNIGGSLTDIVTIDSNGNIVSKPLCLIVRDEKAANTSGGSSVGGADTVRVLNTVVQNDISGASLNANQITLPAGTYRVSASCPAYSSDRHRAMLYNVTDAAVTLLGTCEATSTTVTSRSVIKGTFTISSTKVFEIRHRVNTSFATFGFGYQVNDGRVEIYSEIEIIKEA